MTDSANPNAHQPLVTLDNLKSVRVTQISKFQECPASWRAMMVGEGDRQESQAARTGTAAHRVIEGYLRREFELNAWLPCADYLAREGVTEEESRQIFRYLIDLAPRQGDVLAIEEELDCSLLAGAPFVRGHIDVIFQDPDGGLTIRDHKTNRRLESVAEWRQKTQPRFYSAMVRQKWPARRPIRFEIGYVLLGKTISWETSPEDDFAVYETYQEFWDGFQFYQRTGEWPERVNDNCRFCSIRRECPTIKRATEGFQIAFLKQTERPLPEQLAWVKSVLKAVEAQCDELKMQIIANVQEAGGWIDYGDQRYSVQPSRRRDIGYRELWWKLWELCGWLGENGQRELGGALWERFNTEVNQLVNVRMGAFDRLLEDFPILKEHVEPLVKVVESETPTLTIKARKGENNDGDRCDARPEEQG